MYKIHFYKKLPLAALVMSIVCLPGNAAKALAALAFLVGYEGPGIPPPLTGDRLP